MECHSINIIPHLMKWRGAEAMVLTLRLTETTRVTDRS
jgi:hypothetical protein